MNTLETNLLCFLPQVCLEKMQDLQLALVISRLYESEFETASTYKKILQRHVLGQDKQVKPQFCFVFFKWENAFFDETPLCCLTLDYFVDWYAA